MLRYLYMYQPKQLLLVALFFIFSIGLFVNAPSAHASPCSVYQSGLAVPTGFGVPYSFFSTTRHLLVSADCQGGTVNLSVGSGSNTEYVYEKMYEWNQAAQVWQDYTLAGTNKTGTWIAGKGAISKPSLTRGQPVYFVGYVCTWDGVAWKCGCRDIVCAQSFWQLQGYIDFVPGGSSGAGSSSGGNVAHSSYVPSGYTLQFNDEFDQGLSLDPGCNGNGTWATYWCKWNVRVLWDNSERAVKTHEGYTKNGATLGIKLHEITPQNTLKLYGKEWPANKKQAFSDEPYYADLPWLGGMISSENSDHRTYGYWETRVKMNTISKGHHIAFWLIPKSGDWPPEIDILEVSNDNGSAENKFFFNSHGGPGGGINWVDVTPQEMQAWHTLGFLWTKDEMIWYLDGKEVRKHANYVDEDMYFLIAPEIGGNWPGKPNGNTTWPMEVEVDYVRVYSNTGGGGSSSGTGNTSSGSTSGGSTSGGAAGTGSSSSGSGSTSSGGSTSGKSQYIPAGYNLTWSDEFDTLSLDSCQGNAKWGDHFCGWGVRHLQGNNDEGYKTSGNGLHVVNNGILSLYGKNQGGGGFRYTAGMISNQETHSQLYGYYEIRAQHPNISKGHHIAYWLVPSDNSWPPEIDILEIVDDNGNSEGKWHYNTHGGGPGFAWDDPGHGTGWRTLGFEWTPSEMNWYVDGKKVHGGANYVNKPMYLMISPEIGGDWPGDPDGSTQWPMQVDIDYVRIYQK